MKVRPPVKGQSGIICRTLPTIAFKRAAVGGVCLIHSGRVSTIRRNGRHIPIKRPDKKSKIVLKK